MTPRHIYDVEGYWVAFVVGAEVFLRGGEWLGQLAGNNEIRDREGELRGVVDEQGRLSIVESWPFGMTVSR
jgi:hypothetical protein